MTVILAFLLALFFRTVALEPFNIPSSSMAPTLLAGDYLFVAKARYGLSRYSIPLSPDLFSGRIFGAVPKRGDVVVFKNMHDGYQDYIKRVIGLPGDHVQFRGGVPYINGQPATRRPAESTVRSYAVTFPGGPSYEIAARGYTETLPGGASYQIFKLTDEGFANNTPDYLVPPDDLFVVGDNRDDSLDSRFMEGNGVGFVPVETLVGQASFIYFSMDGDARKPSTVRWDRILSSIH